MPMLKEKSKFPIIVTTILLFLIFTNSRSVTNLKSSINRINTAETKIDDLAKQNEDLKEKIEQVSTEEYVEKEAVEKLNLTKPGQKIIIMEGIKPKDDIEKTNPAIPEPNWKLWLNRLNISN